MPCKGCEHDPTWPELEHALSCTLLFELEFYVQPQGVWTVAPTFSVSLDEPGGFSTFLGLPQKWWFIMIIMENHILMDDLGVPPFLETFRSG